MTGGTGDDTLIGSPGGDIIRSGSGNDLVRPGRGIDNVDVGVVSENDVGMGSDVLDLSDLASSSLHWVNRSIVSGMTINGDAYTESNEVDAASLS